MWVLKEGWVLDSHREFSEQVHVKKDMSVVFGQKQTLLGRVEEFWMHCFSE